jgi:hypothetical protein
MNHLIIANKIQFLLVPSFLENDFKDVIIDYYDSEAAFLSQFGSTYRPLVPSIESLYEDSDLDNVWSEVVSASLYGDAFYHNRLVEDDNDEEYMEFFQERDGQFSNFVYDVEAVYKHYHLTYHISDEIINKPVKEVW